MANIQTVPNFKVDLCSRINSSDTPLNPVPADQDETSSFITSSVGIYLLSRNNPAQNNSLANKRHTKHLSVERVKQWKGLSGPISRAQTRTLSQMAPYSLGSALLLTWSKAVHHIGNRVPLGDSVLAGLPCPRSL